VPTADLATLAMGLGKR